MGQVDRLSALGCQLSADPQATDLLLKNRLRIFEQ
jgi:hypothetical protein